MEHQVVYHADTAEKALGGGVYRRVLAYQPQMMLAEVRFEKGSCGAMHAHPHVQSTYVLKGVFEFNIDGALHTVRAGDTLTFFSNQQHGCTCLEDGILMDVFTPMREDFL